VSWVGHQREGLLHGHLLYDVHLVAFSPLSLTLRLSERAPRDLPHRLQTLLRKERGEEWKIAISDEIGHPTLHEKKQKSLEDHRQAVLQAPLVKTFQEVFPDATLIGIEEKIKKERDNVW